MPTARSRPAPSRAIADPTVSVVLWTKVDIEALAGRYHATAPSVSSDMMSVDLTFADVEHAIDAITTLLCDPEVASAYIGMHAAGP
ncbi:MAG: hypothetical protein U0359_13235 [Byssovorax sp.]